MCTPRECYCPSMLAALATATFTAAPVAAAVLVLADTSTIFAQCHLGRQSKSAIVLAGYFFIYAETERKLWIAVLLFS